MHVHLVAGALIGIVRILRLEADDDLKVVAVVDDLARCAGGFFEAEIGDILGVGKFLYLVDERLALGVVEVIFEPKVNDVTEWRVHAVVV